MRSPKIALAAYAVLAAGNLLAAWTADETLEWLTKPLLMPLLAVWLWLATRAAGRQVTFGIVSALLFSAAGDIALLNDGTGWFIAGMGLFFLAHVSYIVTFAGHGAFARLRTWPLLLVPTGYAIFLVTALSLLWSGLSALGLAVPMAGYALALATTGATAAAFGWRTALGGGLFLLSDLLIAIDKADALSLAGPPIWVMLTYLAAQTLLAVGWLHYCLRGSRDAVRATQPAAA